MPQQWKTYKLYELCSKIGSGATPRGGKNAYKEEGISLIRSQNVLDFRFSEDGLAFIDDDQAAGLSNVTIEPNDVLINITGDSVARVCQVPDDILPARVNQHVSILRPVAEKFSPELLKYYLLSPQVKNQLLTMAGSGATRNALTKIMLEDFEITIPESLPEQHAIAEILSSLDDKIELNLQTNKTLEEMAMTLYKHWFVDFGPFQDGEFVDSELGRIPKGWEVKRLGDVYSTTSGGTPSRKKAEYYSSEGIPWVKSKELYTDFVIDTEENITQMGLKNSSAKLLPNKAVLLAMYGATVGESSILSIEATCNQAICAILQEELSFIYIFLYLRIYKSDILNRAVGSAQQNISQVIIKGLDIIFPPTGLEIFKELEDLYAQIEQNLFENRQLIKTRDTLLPKLVSGEVQVKEVENQLEEVM